MRNRPGRRVQRDIQRLAAGLPLHILHRHVKIKMLRPYMPELMLQHGAALLLGQDGVYIC